MKPMDCCTCPAQDVWGARLADEYSGRGPRQHAPLRRFISLGSGRLVVHRNGRCPVVANLSVARRHDGAYRPLLTVVRPNWAPQSCR